MAPDTDDESGALEVFGISEMDHTTAVSLNGLKVPSWFTAYVRPGDDGWTIAIRVEVDPDLGAVATGVQTISNRPRRPYRHAVAALKGQDLDGLVHKGVLMAAGALSWQQGRARLGKADGEPLTQAEATNIAETELRAAQARMAAVEPPSRRRTLTPALLREVAGVYRDAAEQGNPPTVAVAKQFHVSHRTAGRWVAAAREGGHLGAAVGTKAGEAPPTE